MTHVSRNDLWPARETDTEWPPFVIDENKHGYVFCAAVPGFRGGDVTVRVEGERLLIHGEGHDAEVPSGGDGLASFDRVFALKAAVDDRGVECTLSDGRLTIVLKKAPAPRPANA
jgi:HSP20 family molecular chaperone IbpA